jgi:hypothetical protein
VSYVLKNTMTAYKRRDSKEPCIFIKLHKLQLLETSVRTPLNLGKGVS